MIFSAEEQFALQLDSEDPLRHFRQKFHLPLGKDDRPLIYFAGNSLGLMPKAARAIVEEELDNWAKLGVDAHHATGTPWYTYHEALREPTARLVGANSLEVIYMNSLTVNLHLMMATFYRPTKSRFKILMEEPAFPSDTYAIKTQIVHHGLDPKDALILARPRKNEFIIRTEDIVDLIQKHADQLAVVVLAGVNFFTGQLFDVERITAAAQAYGVVVGFDLAHAIGNVPLSLHDWNVDFAVWCSYKYLNAGPGAVAGAFVHQRHATNRKLPRLAGWFGNDPNTRFRLHLEPEFVPVSSADGWQISNPPIFAMAPLRASLAIFDDAGGMEAGARNRRCEMRFSRTQRHPRRPYLTLQYVSRSLAFCEDSGSASIVAQSITTASLRILALQGDCERMQLGGHQSARDCRIFLHEFSRCVFIGRLKNRNAKRLVA